MEYWNSSSEHCGGPTLFFMENVHTLASTLAELDKVDSLISDLQTKRREMMRAAYRQRSRSRSPPRSVAEAAAEASGSSSGAAPATPTPATPTPATPAAPAAPADPLNLGAITDAARTMSLSKQQVKNIPYMFSLLSRARQLQLTGGDQGIFGAITNARSGVNVERAITRMFVRPDSSASSVGGYVNPRQMWHLADSLEIFSVEPEERWNERLLRGGSGGSAQERGAGRVNPTDKHTCTCTQGNLKYVFIVKAREEYKRPSPPQGRDLMLLGSNCINFLSYSSLYRLLPSNYPRAGVRSRPYLEASLVIAMRLNDFKKDFKIINRARVQAGLPPMTWVKAALKVLTQPAFRNAPLLNASRNEATLMKASERALHAVLKVIRDSRPATYAQEQYIQGMQTERFKTDYTNLRDFMLAVLPDINALNLEQLTVAEASAVIEQMKRKGYHRDNSGGGSVTERPYYLENEENPMHDMVTKMDSLRY